MKFYNVIAIDKTSNNWQKLNQVKINQSKYKLNQSEDTGAIDVYIHSYRLKTACKLGYQ